MLLSYEVEYLGPQETCDQCKKEYPALWIRFTGKEFICLSCEAERSLQNSLKLDQSSDSSAGSGR